MALNEIVVPDVIALAIGKLLPFHAPKLSSVAVGYLTGEDFASRLDRAIERANGAKVIEGRVIEERR